MRELLDSAGLHRVKILAKARQAPDFHHALMLASCDRCCDQRHSVCSIS